MDKIFGYLQRIKNDDKRRYGYMYMAYLRNHKFGNGHVTEPEALCSGMAAQAVRLNLIEMMKEVTR